MQSQCTKDGSATTGRGRQPRLQLIASQKSPITRPPGPALAATAKHHRDLVRVLSARFAYLVGVGALATHPDVIGVETEDVRHGGNQHAVTINVDVVRCSPIPREVHRMPPLHLVAARTERNLPRCRLGIGVGVAVGVGRGCSSRGCCWRRSRR